MIEPIRTLAPRERWAVATLLARVLRAGDPPLLRAILFGSKARGDFDRDSDVDLLLICDVPTERRDRVATALAREAERVGAMTGIAVEPWTVPAADLIQGGRTPMLVDALADGRSLWPRGARTLRLPFTPADARFCARCLVDWVLEGGRVARAALATGRPADAARRARDDITRLATAALLLTGDTRHRRTGSLRRFEDRFVAPRIVSPRVMPALRWAAAAYPADGGRGTQRPPVTPAAARTAELGCQLAAEMESALLPLLIDHIGEG